MSLLSSSALNKEQQKFISKLEQTYHKRGSSFYIPKGKTQAISFTTKTPSQASNKIKILMQDFMTKIQLLLKEFTVIDHYAVLEIMRRNSFFSDVAVEISKDIYMKMDILEKEIAVKEQKIQKLKLDLKDQEFKNQDKLQKIQLIQNKNQIKYNPAHNLATNLYYHAKAMNEQDFIDFYHRTSLTNSIILKNVQKQPQVQNGAQARDTKDIDNIVVDKIDQLLKHAKNRSNEQCSEHLISLLKEYIASKKCKQPCCIHKQEMKDNRLNKARTLINTTYSKSTKDVYKDTKTQQFFQRYYRGSSFNVNDITSVTRTKWEELQRIQNQYKKNIRARRKHQSHHRYFSSVNKQ